MTTTTLARSSAVVVPSFVYQQMTKGRFVGQVCVDVYSPAGTSPWTLFEAVGIDYRAFPIEILVLGGGKCFSNQPGAIHPLALRTGEKVMTWLDRVAVLPTYRGFSVVIPAASLSINQCLWLYESCVAPKHNAEATASKMAQLQFIAEPDAAVLAVANRLAAAKASKPSPAVITAAPAIAPASVEPDSMTDDELATAIADAIVDSPYSPEPIGELKMDYLTVLIESDTKSLKAEWAVANPGVPAPRIRNRDLAMLIWAKSLDMRAMCAIG